MESVQPCEEEREEGDLFVLVPETPQVHSRPGPCRIAPPVSLTLGDLPPGEIGRWLDSPEVGIELQPVTHLSDSQLTSQSVVRRTERRTAGQHSNVHHLPRPVSVGTVSSIAGRTDVLFRPWD